MPSLKSTWRRLLKKPLILYAVSFSVIGGFLIISSFAQDISTTQNFNSDPKWETKNNRPSSSCSTTGPHKFGYSQTNKVNGSGPTGEVGGRVPTIGKNRAYYGKKLSTAVSMQDRLYASGSLIVPVNQEDANAYLGWFNTNSSDWKGNNFLGLHISDAYSAAGSNNAVIVNYATKSGFADGFGPTPENRAGILKAGQKMNWTLDYQPAEGSFGTIHLTVTIGSNTYSNKLALSESFRQDGADFSHFGIFAIQHVAKPDPDIKTIYIDDLTLHIGSGNPTPAETERFDNNPNWDGLNNNNSGPTQECWLRDQQNFGFSSTNNAGGSPGEIGGVIYQAGHGTQSYYADIVANLKLTDTLYATGKIIVNHVNYDTDIPYIGWFNKATSKWGDPNAGSGETLKVQNFIGAWIGGPGSRGHNVEPIFYNNDRVGNLSNGKGVNTSFASVEPKGIAREFWICYVPNADSAGNGRLTTGVSAVASIGREQRSATAIMPAAKKTASTTFDRFGLITPNVGSSALTELYIDDLRYTVGPGDTGPASHCGAPPSGNKTGDIDKDGQVNGRDVSILLANFGKTGTTSDLDNSGRVDGRDVSILLANFGK